MTTQVLPKTMVIGNYKGRREIIAALRGAQFEVIEVTECIRGLKHIVNEAPNIVIINQGKSSVDAIKLLRAVRCLTSAPVILVGPSSQVSTLESEFQGAVVHLPKLFTLETLFAHIHILLSRN